MLHHTFDKSPVFSKLAEKLVTYSTLSLRKLFQRCRQMAFTGERPDTQNDDKSQYSSRRSLLPLWCSYSEKRDISYHPKEKTQRKKIQHPDKNVTKAVWLTQWPSAPSYHNFQHRLRFLAVSSPWAGHNVKIVDRSYLGAFQPFRVDKSDVFVSISMRKMTLTSICHSWKLSWNYKWKRGQWEAKWASAHRP